MKLTPMPPYFYVRLPKKRIEKNGSIIIPDTLRFMTCNLQQGEIIGIGSGAAKYFPEAKIGHTLLMHHFVEGMDDNDARVDHLIDSDENYNYYVVTAYEHNGKNVETYGVWDGEKIIPNKDYIFLHKKEPPKNSDVDLEELGKAIGFVPNVAMTVSGGGLLTFKEWEESRESLEEKQAYLKEHNEYLTRSNPSKQHISDAIRQNEIEMGNISMRINKKKYIPFKVAFYNKEFLTHFRNRKTILPEEKVYVLNIAAHTEINFMNITYIVAKTKYADVIV